MNWEPPTPASRAHVPGAEHRGHLRRRDSTFPEKLAFSLEVGASPARGHSLPCSLRGLETQMRKSPCESRSGQTLPSSFEPGASPGSPSLSASTRPSRGHPRPGALSRRVRTGRACLRYPARGIGSPAAPQPRGCAALSRLSFHIRRPGGGARRPRRVAPLEPWLWAGG